MEEIFTKFWGVILAGIAAIVWMVRLEGRTKANAKDIAKGFEREKEARKDLEAKLDKQRGEDLTNLRQDLGDLGSRLSDVQGDMKEVLKVLGRLGG